MALLKRGQRLLVTRSIDTQVFCISNPVGQPHSVKCTIPKDTVLIVQDDHIEEATAFGCVPERYKDLEAVLVPEVVRNHPEYTSYYVMLHMDEFQERLKFLGK